MTLIVKPNYKYIWAVGGDIVEPTDLKKQQGWTAEVPPFQYENWIQNRQDQYLAHINQRGIPAWDGQTEYEAGGLSYVQGSDGKIYKSVAASGPTSTVKDPTTDATDTYWKVAFADLGQFLDQTQGDARYLIKSNNLSELTNIVTARTNLGLSTGATSTVTTSTNDTTTGRLLKVGDFALGLDANSIAVPSTYLLDNTTDFDTILNAGWYKSLLGAAAGSRNPNHPDGQTAVTAGSGVTNFYWLLVARYSSNTFQVAFPYLSSNDFSGSTIKFRNIGSGSQWSAWKSVYYNGNLPTSSDAVAGIVELATNAEVQTGTDTTRAVTPFGLSSRAATTTMTGLVELATSAEAQAGSDAIRAITPATLSAATVGMGQTWQDVSGSRVAGTTYTNSTGKPIMVSISLNYSSGSSSTGTLVVGGVTVSNAAATTLGGATFKTVLTAIVPNGTTYLISGLSGATVSNWTELR